MNKKISFDQADADVHYCDQKIVTWYNIMIEKHTKIYVIML